MKLTSEDKKLLTEWFYSEEDCKQIERATTKTIYDYYDDKGRKITIKAEEAIAMLGREKYLSGIARSTFHWSSCRENEKGQTVHFDSSKLFKWVMEI